MIIKQNENFFKISFQNSSKLHNIFIHIIVDKIICSNNKKNDQMRLNKQKNGNCISSIQYRVRALACLRQAHFRKLKIFQIFGNFQLRCRPYLTIIPPNTTLYPRWALIFDQ
jgi:hypothetical protein